MSKPTFGDPEAIAALRRLRSTAVPSGYVVPPGTGPKGEVCGTCRHCASYRQSNRWHKCRLMRAHWTNGRKTDVLARSPACKYWEAKDGRKD